MGSMDMEDPFTDHRHGSIDRQSFSTTALHVHPSSSPVLAGDYIHARGGSEADLFAASSLTPPPASDNSEAGLFSHSAATTSKLPPVFSFEAGVGSTPGSGASTPALAGGPVPGSSASSASSASNPAPTPTAHPKHHPATLNTLNVRRAKQGQPGQPSSSIESTPSGERSRSRRGSASLDVPANQAIKTPKNGMSMNEMVKDGHKRAKEGDRGGAGKEALKKEEERALFDRLTNLSSLGGL